MFQAGSATGSTTSRTRPRFVSRPKGGPRSSLNWSSSVLANSASVSRSSSPTSLATYVSILLSAQRFSSWMHGAGDRKAASPRLGTSPQGLWGGEANLRILDLSFVTPRFWCPSATSRHQHSKHRFGTRFPPIKIERTKQCHDRF